MADVEKFPGKLKDVDKESEWTGTGLCSEAQADGVPCPDASCSCDRCGRARKDNGSKDDKPFPTTTS